MTQSTQIDPAPGVAYTRVLVDVDENPMRPVVGLALVLVGYAVGLPLISQGLLAPAWLVRGRPGQFDVYYSDAMDYHYPEGMLISHLALAALIPLVIVVARVVHRRRATWLCSVQPGMRWRFLIVVVITSFVVLNALLWLRGGTPIHPTSHLAGWLVLICVTAPLQAAGEEFLFRGYMQQAVGAMARNRWFGVIASAVVFAFLHGTQNLPLFCDRLGFGLLAGSLVVLTGGLEASIAVHVMNNVLAFGYAALAGGVAQARGMTEIGWTQTAWDLVSFAMCGVMAWWVGRRMNLATRTPS